MDLKAKRVVVTGASGFIGSHLVEELVEGRGANVTAFIRYTSDRSIGNLRYLSQDVLKCIEPVYGDLRQQSSLEGAIKSGDIVFHLGSLISIPYSYQEPQSYVDVNIRGTANVLSACLKAGVERVVIMSTAEVYGTAQYVPMGEEHPLRAQSPYSATKIAAEKLAESYHLSFGLPVTIVRPFNTFGPRQSRRAVIPSIVWQALQGTDIHLGFTESTRDFTYVTDMVRALIALVRAPEARGQVVNIGTGREVSPRQLVELVGNLLTKKLVITTDPRRLRPEQSEVRRHFAETTRLRQLTGWYPQFTLEQGLAKVIDWMAQEEPEVISGPT